MKGATCGMCAEWAPIRSNGRETEGGVCAARVPVWVQAHPDRSRYCFKDSRQAEKCPLFAARCAVDGD